MARTYKDLHRHPVHLSNFGKKSSSKKLFLLWLLFSLFILTLIPSVISKLTSKKERENNDNLMVKPIALSQDKKTSTSKQELLAKIRGIFEGKVGSYSFYIYDLNNEEGFGINEEMITIAASVNKIPILAALYYLAAENEIDLDETITLREADIQDFGTGILRYQRPGTSYSIKTLARLMMEKSDNTAAHILGRLIIGFPRIQQLINQWGLKQTNMENNKTSSLDMALIMTKMYQQEIADEPLTREMLGFMRDTDFEERLPKLLPENIVVYHKTGDEIRNIHDVGIVVLPARPYYIGILTTDLIVAENEVKEAIAIASSLVYEHFKQKN